MKNAPPKPILQSKTIKASISNIIAVVAMLVAFLGLDIDQGTQADIVVVVLAAWKLINDAVAVWGRITASQPLTVGGKLKVPKSKLPLWLLVIGLTVVAAPSFAQDKAPLAVQYDFRTVTGPTVILVDWNNPNIILNNPVTNEPIKAPDLADEFFDALKVALEIKVNNPADSTPLLLRILSQVRLSEIRIDAKGVKQNE